MTRRRRASRVFGGCQEEQAARPLLQPVERTLLLRYFLEGRGTPTGRHWAVRACVRECECCVCDGGTSPRYHYTF